MIKINIREANKVNGEQSAYFSFPYNNTILGVIRSLPSRYWHADSKEWEVPTKKLPELLEQLEAFEIEMTGTVVKEKVLNHDVPADFNFKTNPYSFQMEGFLFGLKHDKFLLGDEQGTGKTKQSIDIAVAKKLSRGYKHCLVVCCVNGTKWNWQNEISVHSNESGYILGTRKRANGKEVIGSTKDKLADLNNLPDSYFIITNIESLRDKEIADKLKQLCASGEIGMIVADEIHKCRNSASQQAKGLGKVQAESMIALSGTPLMNNPIDLYFIMKWLGFEKHSLYQFKNHYCIMGGYGGYEIIGYKNLAELQENLNDIMLRRLKKDVLDLPEKVYSTEYVEMGTKQATIYNEVLKAVKENIDKIKVSPNPLDQLIRLRQATGYPGILSSAVMESAKLDRLEELVAEAVESGDKCLIFSNWTTMTDAIETRLKAYFPAVITGETVDRVAQEKKFMEDDRCKCIIGTIGAMGTGLTLTAGSTVIFVDEPWNRGNKEQAEDRAHRIGTKNSVNIISLITKNTIDERIHEIIYKKGMMADMLVDGTVDITQENLLDMLLS